MKYSVLRRIGVIAVFCGITSLAGAADSIAVVEIVSTHKVSSSKFNSNTLIHTNRPYRYGDIPKSLAGLVYTMHEHKKTSDLTCRVKTGGVLYLVMEGGDKPSKFSDGEKWKKTDIVIKNKGSGGEPWRVYERTVSKGDELKVKSLDRWGSVILAKQISGR